MKERIKSKLKEPKRTQPNLKIEDEEDKDEEINDNDANKDEEVEEYYLGKDRDDERKRKAYATLF